MYLRILTKCFEINYRENPILYLRIENTGTHLVNFVITLFVTEATNMYHASIFTNNVIKNTIPSQL